MIRNKILEQIKDTGLKNKNVLLVGGYGGIGKSIADELRNEGANVYITTSNSNKVGKDDFFLDMTYPDMFETIVENIVKKIGNIDILICCAGVLSKYNYQNITIDDYDRVMSINVRGPFFLCRVVSEHMIKNGIKGNILLVSSSSALRPSWSVYELSKRCISGFTIGLADMLIKHEIVVNAIAPGPTATKMLGVNEDDDIILSSNPSSRYVLPEEIAKMASYMISSYGRMLVGEVVYITGGSGILSLHN